jgi:hypothetical protein
MKNGTTVLTPELAAACAIISGGSVRLGHGTHEQPPRFQFPINLKTSTALSLEFPASIFHISGEYHQ